MSSITDDADVPLTYISMTMNEESDSPVFVIKVPCVSGAFLKARSDANEDVLARLSGIGSYVDIDTSPFDLSPYAGETKSFDIKIHTNDVVGLVHAAVPIIVTFNP